MRKPGGGWESGVGLKARLDLNKKKKCGRWLPYHDDPPSARMVMLIVILMITLGTVENAISLLEDTVPYVRVF